MNKYKKINIPQPASKYLKEHFFKLAILIDGDTQISRSNKDKILFYVKLYVILKNKDRRFSYLIKKYVSLSLNKTSLKMYNFFKDGQNIISIFLKKGINKKEFLPCCIQSTSYEIMNIIVLYTILERNKNQNNKLLLMKITRVLQKIQNSKN